MYQLDTDLIRRLEQSEMSDQIQKTGLKLSIEKCQIGKHSIEILGKTNLTGGTAPIRERITKFLKNLKLTSSVKTLKRYLGFVNFYRQYKPRLAYELIH